MLIIFQFLRFCFIYIEEKYAKKNRYLKIPYVVSRSLNTFNIYILF